MGTLIVTKDGKREYISRDRHFYDLLRDYIGDDASDFYRERIEEMEKLFDELKQLLDTEKPDMTEKRYCSYGRTLKK